MDEVEAAGRLVRCDVVAQDLETLMTRQPTGVDVGGDDAAVAAMAMALRPGGWLVLEDADPALQPLLCPEETGPAEVLGNRVRRGFRSLLAARGADLQFGRTLPRRLREVGLRAVSADAYFPMTGPACAVLERATVLQVRDLLVAAGLVTEADIAEHLANVGTGRMVLATAPLITAWGQRADNDRDADHPPDAD